MKILHTISLLFFATIVFAQKNVPATNELTITGKIKNEIRFNLADLEKLPAKSIPDLAIVSHSGESRGTAKQLQGVLVRDLLLKAEPIAEHPKYYGEFYLVFTAIDNYKVVYSWNEIFNSPTGDNLYIITAKDGKKLREMEDRILVLTPGDFKTGRRHIKGLEKIVFKAAD